MTATTKKDYLSYSQIALWNGGLGKKEYITQYFMGIKPPTSPQMMKGSNIHDDLPDLLELDEDDINEFEYKIEENISGVNCLGYIDSIDFTNGILYEYKTGKPWTYDAVQNHKQLHMYYLLYKARFGVYPNKVVLGHIDINEGVITETEYVPDVNRLETFIQEIKDTREGIDNAWNDFINTKDEALYISERLCELMHKMQELKDQEDVLRNKLIDIKPEGYTDSNINLYTVKKVATQYPMQYYDEVALIKDKYDSLSVKKDSISYGIKYKIKQNV